MTKLGRPQKSDSQATRLRILTTARRLFADRGWDGTSNRALADAVGLTTGALYHYFDRKLDLYEAVYAETQRFVYEHLNRPVDECDTFIDALRGVLDAAHDLNNEDESLALFLGSCRTDVQRHPELRSLVRGTVAELQDDFYARLVGLGVRTGEIDACRADQITVLLQTLTIGLVDAVSSDRERHRDAVDAIVMLFEGKLVRAPA